MDKDFIKIDDLVKLRLGGGEEAERSGSWLNMRELLDKEMPQDRAGGIIYWRRTFNIVAALSLLATIGIGGYELAASHKNATTGSSIVADVPGAAGTDASAKNTEAGNVYQVPDAATAASITGKKKAIAARISEARTVPGDNVPVNNNSGHKQDKYAAGTGSTHTAIPGQRVADNSGTVMSKVSVEVKANEASGKSTNNVTAENNRTATNGQGTKRHGSHNHTTAAPATNERAAHEQVVKKEHTTRHIGTGNVTTGVTSNTTIKHTSVAATSPATAHEDKKVNNNNNNAAPKNISTAATKPADTKTTGIDKMALSSAATVAVKNTAAHSPAAVTAIPDVATVNRDVKNADAKNPVAGKTENKTAISRNTSGTATAGTASDNNVTGAGVPKLTAAPVAKVAKPAMDDAALKTVSVMNMSKGKKVIERMILHERFIKTSPSEGYFKLDTISVETLTTELGMKTDNNTPSSHVYTVAKKQGASGSAQTNGSSAGEADAASGAIVPAATANGQSAPALKAAGAVQKGSGSKIVEKLNATFNDIKYKFGAPRFQAGVTAGINGTFFGPNSFKGFQFGLTGNLVFNDQWSILSELKYFQRINGNTSIEDNYNTYTPTANGQFTKQQQMNSYSFSALHSLEMPISIRYCMGNFNFFTGGNLVYTFSINTGAESMPSASAPVTVAAAGSDNAPELSERDFRSRIGLGYMLGLSYNVAPSTMLDLRSVQTVWDNANSAGSKSVSSQLYKSPSLQLSIIYRLGGNRHKE